MEHMSSSTVVQEGPLPWVPERLLVARRDNTETSTCIVTPPEVNFLLNGKSVERRTTVSMDYGPQFPTDVTPMLKYGTNLLQAIGNFDGNYIIVIAYMRAISPSDIAVLQDYVQPAASALSSDTEIIEGPSRISLNCPISFKRIKTPVKGHLCRHHQCFDYYNFMEINSRKPSWRCPHCNQPISFTDIRIDQNMAKVLREAGDDVSDVLISADGSWKVVTGLDHADQNDLDDGSEQCQTMKLQNIPAAVVDLTMEDTDVLNETNSGGAETSVAFAEQRNVDSSETEDRKPLEDILEDLCSTENLTEPSFVNSASEAIQGAYQVGHDFWSRILSSTSATNGAPAPTIRTDAHIQSSSTTIRADTYVQFSPDDGMLTPMLTDAVPAAVNREPVDGRSMTQPIISYPNVPQVRQFVATENMQLQQSRFGNSIVNSETGRQLIPRHISRSPIAIQALPAQTQVSNSHLQRPRTSILSPNPMISRGASPTVPQTSSMSHTQDGLNAVGTDMEGQQILRSQMDPHSASDIASSSLQFHTMAQSWDHHGCQPQIVGLPPTSQISMRMPSDQQRAGAFRSTLGLSLDHQNIHRQGPPNRVPQTMNEPASLLQHSRFASVQVQQPVQSVIGIAAGSSTNQFMVSQNSSQVARSVGAPVQLQGPRAVSSFAMPSDGLRQPIMDQRQNLGVMQSSDNLPELPSEKNWRPTGRMRGSLSGRALSSGLSQYIVQPTPPAQARPPPITTQANASTLQVLVAKSMNAHGQTPPSYSRTADGGAQGSLGSPSPQ